MRQVDLQVVKAGDKPLEQWIGEQFNEINIASAEDAGTAAADAIDLDHSLVVEAATFDPTTATLDELRMVVATLIMYIQKRGPQKSQ